MIAKDVLFLPMTGKRVSKGFRLHPEVAALLAAAAVRTGQSEGELVDMCVRCCIERTVGELEKKKLEALKVLNRLENTSTKTETEENGNTN